MDRRARNGRSRGLRRLEIPEDMQKEIRLQAAGGRPDGPVKTAIFSGNSARLYGLEKARRTYRAA